MDLFKELLPILQSGTFQDILDISDADLKKISPLIALKMMASVKGKNAQDALLLYNEIANEGFFELRDHPRLQLMLLMTLRQQGRNYFAGTHKKDTVSETIQKFYPHLKKDEIDMLINMSSKEEIIDLGSQFGMQDKELKEWKKNVEQRFKT